MVVLDQNPKNKIHIYESLLTNKCSYNKWGDISSYGKIPNNIFIPTSSKK